MMTLFLSKLMKRCAIAQTVCKAGQTAAISYVDRKLKYRQEVNSTYIEIRIRNILEWC